MLLYLLVALIIFLQFYHLGSFQVWIPNESFYAYASRHMMEYGDFITPYYNGEVRLNKPPMTYWLAVVGYWLLGCNEWGLRIMHVFLSLLTGVLTAVIAYELTSNTKVGILSFAVLTTSFLFFANGRYVSPEVPLTFFVTATLWGWLMYYRKRNWVFLVLAFLFATGGVLTKGPVAFAMPALVVLLYLLLTDPKELTKKSYYFLGIFFFFVSMWWHAFQLIFHREEFLKVFYEENLKRVWGGEDPWYFYLLDTLVSFLPYSFLFYLAVVWFVKERRKELTFPFVWFLVYFLIFSIIKQKIPVYVLPAYPAMAVLTAAFLEDTKMEKVKTPSVYFLSYLMGIAYLILVLYLGLSYLFLLAVPLFFLAPKLTHSYAPLLSGILFLFLLIGGVLPWLETYRPYRDLGSYIKHLDPAGKLPVYELTYFHHNLPFYAERNIIRNKMPVKGSIVIYPLSGGFVCSPSRTFVMYTGSESRLLRYILDAKKGKRFETFGVCVYN
ncbi:glycosyl transferase family 39 [Thermocrinis albus DSM 14484]|uniref:Glycosyl transferase family 39 n=1 Tax=Thermocrinis albus (strain DSM 14484 / JCM 11386 / HI 11/12) TaxID=638303 RepID=D3SN11_THEAH|nr:glycosyltransferase family 39 protein [Thermocrinis albus]ADC90141.1 glycosyl transferase family 39 [Thermocrinis albus DSM 14484]